MERTEIEIVRHYAPDPAACVRALLALLMDDAPPAQAERHPRLATVKGDVREPAKVSSGAHSIQHRRRRAKAGTYEPGRRAAVRPRD